VDPRHEGDSWFLLEDVENFWAVAFANPDAGWLVGTGGRILKISIERRVEMKGRLDRPARYFSDSPAYCG
jgi:hypothetical protein